MRPRRLFALPLALALAGCRADAGSAEAGPRPTDPRSAAPPPASASGELAPSASSSPGPLEPSLPAAGRLLPDAPPEAVGLDPGELGAIDAAVADAIGRGEVPGAVVLVARHGQVAFRRAYGALAVEPEREPMRDDAVFDLASLTKPFATALAVMALVDDGALALGTRVGKLLPELDGTPAGAPTVEQLLLHTGGYPVGAAPVELERGLGHGLEVLAARARAGSASFATPGSAFEYSDLGYIVLGAVVERVSREPLEAFVSSRLYARLGLRDTGFRRFRSTDALDCPSPTMRELGRLVPTERRGPAFLRGEVHDPLAYALGGVAGNAGLFATADDVAALAQAVLDGGALRGAAPASGRLLSERQAREMTRPRAVPGGKRALGWDVDTKYSGARGGAFPVGGFGHTGFTGTSVWADRASDTLVVVLASRLHPAGKGDAGPLRRRVATLVGRALRAEAAPAPGPPPSVRTGIDVLEREGFRRLRGRRVGLLTHLPATDGAGRTTLELLAHAPEIELVRLFAPEHGLDARADGAVASGREPTTGLPLVGLYGAHDRPSAAELAGLDVLVVDLVDVGARFYTYLATLAYALEAAASAGLPVLVLDRPSPGGGLDPEGPLTDPGREVFVAPHRLPVRHALTEGELARLLCAERRLACRLDVVAVEGWRRGMRFSDTGLPWRAPSPALPSAEAALLYPGVGLLEMTNVSVGRGTERPFALVGAPWIDGAALAAALGSVPGVRIRATRFTPRGAGALVHHAGQTCGGVALEVTDAPALRPVRLGIALAAALVGLHGPRFEVERMDVLLRHAPTLALLRQGASPDAIVASWAPELEAFEARRAPFLLY